ncbi:YdcH family protein [Paracoccus sp. (in: a-proteobacteria)]|uniref:YdcH family protein n=1 Tax=Paracoccus sp. TaxID=267 RepID=UPI0026DFF457|nr:DUF465 domain-containing protein [Paracoccus sp. (in: a-proteobacteria)]MDO5647277.1 DUF465 domain-containing protein [Paracoccus sp. (in: a-proteobacteria)]
MQHMTHDEILRTKLAALRAEHRELDNTITAMHQEQRIHSLTLQRLKRQKLALKDQITRLEDEITPDIIA